MTLKSVITLDQQIKKGLSWWITNMKIYNGKSLLIVPPDLTIFSDKWMRCFGLRDYHGGSVVCNGESLARKCSRIGSSEAIVSFIYKIKKTKFHSSTDSQLDSSLLFIKHGKHPEQIFSRNLERNLGLSHREENTFYSRRYTQSEQSNSRLGIPKTSRTVVNENFAQLF